MDRMFEVLANLIERVLAVAFVFSVGLNFSNVVDRYIFGATILSADEIQIYTMIWITFLGAAVVTWRRQHLRMDVLLRMFPLGMQTALRACELILLVGLAGFIAVNSWDYTARIYAIGRTSDTAGIPLWTIHIALPLGFGLIAAISLWRLARWCLARLNPTAGFTGAPE
jgi:TRAP-type C4-dicarboxylate transport system permease small subunit